mgnify:FL=1
MLYNRAARLHTAETAGNCKPCGQKNNPCLVKRRSYRVTTLFRTAIKTPNVARRLSSANRKRYRKRHAAYRHMPRALKPLDARITQPTIPPAPGITVRHVFEGCAAEGYPWEFYGRLAPPLPRFVKPPPKACFRFALYNVLNMKSF